MMRRVFPYLSGLTIFQLPKLKSLLWIREDSCRFVKIRVFALAFWIALVTTITLPLGCVSSPQLTVTSIDHNQSYRETFTQAYTRVDPNGDTDVVLVDGATEKALDGHADPSAVRQVMHIRVVWEPTRDMKAIVSNATVNWYVIHQGQPQDVLEYSGIAFVSMDEGDDTTTLNVRNATLKPSN
jgi:hypothetical protein